jgi:hypothetical protein
MNLARGTLVALNLVGAGLNGEHHQAADILTAEQDAGSVEWLVAGMARVITTLVRTLEAADVCCRHQIWEQLVAESRLAYEATQEIVQLTTAGGTNGHDTKH